MSALRGQRSFTHLHLHTEYSMLDGAARVEDVVAAAAADGQPAIGITDHGNMYGVLEFYKACQQARDHADHRHRGLHGRATRASTARCGEAGSTTPAAKPSGGEKLYYHLTAARRDDDGLPEPHEALV